MVYKTNDKQNKNTTHYVLETTTIKQTQLTGDKDEPNIVFMWKS